MKQNICNKSYKWIFIQSIIDTFFGEKYKKPSGNVRSLSEFAEDPPSTLNANFYAEPDSI